MSHHLRNRFTVKFCSVGLGTALAVGGLFWAGATLGGDPPAAVAVKPADLSAVQLIVRGPDDLVAGQPCTLEIFLVNNGTADVRDLELQLRLDANLVHETKQRDHTVAVAPIAADDVQVVRIRVTPQKVGPGGLDLTMKAKAGAATELRHVFPVGPEDPTRTAEAPGLKFKITSLKECYAGRPGIVLVNVRNTDSKATAKTDLILCHAAMGRSGQMLMTQPQQPGNGKPMAEPAPAQPHFEGKGGARMMMPVQASSNPTRQVPLAVPALAPGESLTLPVRLTARRIGDLGIAIVTSVNPKDAAQPLATARVKVKFDPKMPLDNLVPVRSAAVAATRLPQTLAEVPELSLEDPAEPMKAEEAFEYVAHMVEKINHVNTGKTDAFVEALLRQRADLRGLPFVMGDDCRLSPERGQHFLSELTILRGAMGNPAHLAASLPNPAANQMTESAMQARVAALMQVVGPEGEQLNRQAVKYMASMNNSQTTMALARLAIFAEEEAVRKDAIAALASRREQDYTKILAGALNYPWPAVAERAGAAIVALKRHDLLPQLVDTLERPDPRAPQAQSSKEKDGKHVTVVRELVRINHLRNCLLCHSPMDASKAPAGGGGGARDLEQVRRGDRGFVAVGNGLTAPVPLPGQNLPTPTTHGGYGSFTIPDTLLSFDVTYLRQDFSVKLPVAKAQPWPDTQRFDFLVRTRELTDKEAEAHRALLAKANGDQSPYQRTALASLRQLTGRDAEPTAAAWRRVLAEHKTEK